MVDALVMVGVVVVVVVVLVGVIGVATTSNGPTEFCVPLVSGAKREREQGARGTASHPSLWRNGVRWEGAAPSRKGGLPGDTARLPSSCLHPSSPLPPRPRAKASSFGAKRHYPL